MYKINDSIGARSIANSLMRDLALFEGDVSLEQFLLWPPDLFALTSKIFSLSGAYTNVISPPKNKNWPPKLEYLLPDDCKSEYNGVSWNLLMRKVANKWRKGLEKIPNLFESYEDYFQNSTDKLKSHPPTEFLSELAQKGVLPQEMVCIWASFIKTIDPERLGRIEEFMCITTPDCMKLGQECTLGENPTCKSCRLWHSFEGLMSLHAIADEACAGWGIRTERTNRIDRTKSKAQKYAETHLNTFGTLSTINTARCRILPKRHTPNVGITLRSISSNLAHHHSSVNVKWKTNFEVQNSLTSKLSQIMPKPEVGKAAKANNNSISVLLLPYPFKIFSTDFKIISNPNIDNHNDNYDFFSFDPEIDLALESTLESAISEAKKENPCIDLVILPEGALDEEGISVLEKVLSENKIPAYITGKRMPSIHSPFQENRVQFNMIDANNSFNKESKVDQSKHHRWKLSKTQIIKYNLGHILTPNKNWWEGIDIKRREVNFINIGEEVTICPLICEDLARQDPIADLIRTVGPSLVVTILMDGPQNFERWPAKYANVLSEDPGCAVITLTSLGMVKRNNPKIGRITNSIAIVSDCEGQTNEIEMAENSMGVLLNLCLTPKNVKLADGRVDQVPTNKLIVGSIHQLIKPR